MLTFFIASAKFALFYFPLLFVLVRFEAWLIGAIADGYQELLDDRYLPIISLSVEPHMHCVRPIEDLNLTEFLGKELPFVLGRGLCISIATFLLVQFVLYMGDKLLVSSNVSSQKICHITRLRITISTYAFIGAGHGM
jgi:hypothetical protein